MFIYVLFLTLIKLRSHVDCCFLMFFCVSYDKLMLPVAVCVFARTECETEIFLDVLIVLMMLLMAITCH